MTLTLAVINILQPQQFVYNTTRLMCHSFDGRPYTSAGLELKRALHYCGAVSHNITQHWKIHDKSK